MGVIPIPPAMNRTRRVGDPYPGTLSGKALRGPLVVMLAPTGGIGVDEIASYLAAGSSFVGVGGKLVDVAALRRNDKDAITSAAKTALSQVAAARG